MPMRDYLIFHFFSLFLRHSPELHGVAAHAQLHALLQPTVLTAVPVHAIHCAVLLSGTLVADALLTLRAAEEALR